jgi:hypothetical protein
MRTSIHCCMMAAMIASLATFAQDPRGRIVGRAIDTSGASVPGVMVVATNIESGTAVTATTNEQGNYVLLYMVPGRYRVSVEHAGFKRFERSEVEVRAGDALRIDVTLEPGAVSESITVTAETPLLESTEASVGQLIDRRRLHDLPLAGGNPLYLLQLTPGIISTNASTHGWFPHALDAISQVAASGTRTRSNQFTLDGNPIMTRNGQVTYSPPPEMIQEMKIQTAPFDASLGGFSGANFNIVTRSGTNEYRGDLWFSHYSRPLTTRNFFVNRFIFDPNTGPITEEKKKSQWPPVQTNRYRATGSAPIVKNKTFLVYSFDKLFRKRPQTGVNTVPTMAQRQGDFSDLLALGPQYQIYDPATIAPAPGGRFSRQPLPGNIIPQSRIDPVSRNLLQFYPAPNDFSNREGRNNFIHPIGSKIDYFSHSFRVDHTFSDKHRIYGSFAISNLDEPAGRRFPDNIAVGQVEDRRHRGVTLDDVYVVTPATVLNVRYGLTRYLNNLHPDSIGIDLAALGFAPALVNQLDPRIAALPRIQIQGMQPLSQDSGRISATNYHTVTGTVSTIKGNHSFKYGGEFRVYQDNRWVLGNVSPVLDYQFGWTRGPLDNSPNAPIGQGMASFLFGLPTGGGKDINDSFAQQSRYIGLFFQNDWKITPAFTVNLGLRWETETPTRERYNRTVRGFDFDAVNPIQDQARQAYATSPIPELPPDQFHTRGGLLFAGVGGTPAGLWRQDLNNFAPRIGFAWNIRPKTVLRGGYGIFYQQLGANFHDVIQQGFSQRTSLVASLDNGLSFVASTGNPFPDGFIQPAGASGGLLTFVGRSPEFFNPEMRTGYMQRWSFNIQRELPWRMLLDAGYVGNRGTKLPMQLDGSALPERYWSTSPLRDNETIDYLTRNFPNPFRAIPEFAGTSLAGANIQRQQLLTPMPHFFTVNYMDDIGFSWYHSLQMRLEKRLQRGMTFGFSYTWSKFMEAVERLNTFDIYPTKVISPQDRPHHFAFTGIYELPFGRRQTFLANTNKWLDGVLGGWSVQAIYQYQTGAPIEWGNVLHIGDIKNIPLSSRQRSVERWFNTDDFNKVPAEQLLWNRRTFPLRLNGVRQDGFNQWDLSVFKNFAITERVRFQLRAEGQNAMNKAMFNPPNAVPTNTLFGQVIATQFPEARRITLAGKLSF